MNRHLRWCVFPGLAWVLSSAVWAHHSTARYDYSKSETLAGTVKAWQYTNPHSFLQVLVSDGKGGYSEWSIEAGPVSPEAARVGWTLDAFKPGDKVTLVIAPVKDGSHGGTIRTATFSDGRVLTALTANIKAGQSGQPEFGLGLPEIKRATPKPAAQSQPPEEPRQ
jgi:hypothetical protein